VSRGAVAGRLRGRALIAASWVACRLPEGPLVRAAELAGDLWYRAAPDRAAQARRNLRRVVTVLAARERGPAYVQAAASDPRVLESLVRRAFRHAARYYLEVARTPAVAPEDIAVRMLIETPDIVEEAFAGDAVIFVGLHFGAIELPGLLLASRVGGAVGPMETIDDPGLQDWFVRTRGAMGIRIVGLREARRELLAALRDGTSVGLVGDRDLTGGGTLTDLFGSPATLPLGPAMLAVESGAKPYVVGVRRTGVGRYRGRLERVTVRADGTRRERVTTTTGSIATAFERVIEDAPEQWWAVFFPIWPDLEAEAAGTAPTVAGVTVPTP
jgi:lauroyl/myristoyl acyltransferase